jgi:hypothetical protein
MHTQAAPRNTETMPPIGNQTQQETPMQEEKLPFVVADRTLADHRVTTVETSPFKLPRVRDYLAKLERLQMAADPIQSLDRVRVSFADGHMTARLMEHNGFGAPMLFSANGASQMARMVLPSRFFSGLRQLALMDDEGGRLATDAWNKFASVKDKERMIRTVNMQVGGRVRRVVRSCHSTGYATYSNRALANDLINHAGHYSSLPVLGWHVTDSAMRLRFAGIDAALEVLRHWDAGALADEPIPMVECWNSEVGRRKVGLRAGLFHLDTGGCIPHWDQHREFSWIHRGDPERIQSGVQGAFEDLLGAARAVVEAYKESTGVGINDVYTWLMGEMRRVKSPDRLIATAKEKLDAEIGEGHAGSLSAAVNAVTLAALDEKDIFQQYDVERLASALLKRGLDQARVSHGKIEVGA